MHSYRVVSLYSGAGGLDYGFKLAGFQTLFANDVDATAMQTYSRLIGTEGTAGDIADQTLPDPTSVDVVIGGPPCQGFSVAGKMNPNDKRSEHVWKFLEIVEQLQPAVFVMENVKALAVNKRWATIRDGLTERAAALGYTTEIFVLKASNYGVPQNRERMFLIGALQGMPKMPEPTTAENMPTVRAALAELPPYGKAGNDWNASAVINRAKNPILRRSPFAGMLFNGAGRPVNLDGQSPTLPASMGGSHTPIIDQRWLESGDPNHWVRKYHAYLMAGGEPAQYEDVPSYLRRLTAQEAAALQTFPKELEWAGAPSAVFRQIGNAVPPLLGKAVADSIRDLLDEIPEHSVARTATL